MNKKELIQYVEALGLPFNIEYILTDLVDNYYDADEYKDFEYKDEKGNGIQSIGQDTMADTHTRNVLDESRQDTEPEAQR